MKLDDVLKIRLFPFSLPGTTFTWFASLAPNSVHVWSQLEDKFHEYFYSADTELRLSHLISIKQKYNEHVADFIKSSKIKKNRCFNLTLFEKDLAELVYLDLLSHLKEKLEGYDFQDVSQVWQRALEQESRAKESRNF